MLLISFIKGANHHAKYISLLHLYDFQEWLKKFFITFLLVTFITPGEHIYEILCVHQMKIL